MRKSVLLLLALLAAAPTRVASAGDQAARVFNEASPSVYSIFAEQAGGRTNLGSGVVIGSGRIVTNYHVISGAERIRVKHGKEEVEAVLESGDKGHDLALLQAPGIRGPAVRIGISTDVRIGQTVYAIGSPRGLELSLSEGLISSLRETPDGLTLQTTAPISPGSSGGGLFDAEARLIGFTTAQVINGQNLNFAVPVEWLRFVGVSVQPATVAATPVTAEATPLGQAPAEPSAAAAIESAVIATPAAADAPVPVARSPNLYIGTILIAVLLLGAKPAINWLSEFLARDESLPPPPRLRATAAAGTAVDRLAPFRIQPREEIKSGQRDADVWLLALEECGGDESRATVAYIEMRARSLQRADMDRRWEEAKAGGIIQRHPSGK